MIEKQIYEDSIAKYCINNVKITKSWKIAQVLLQYPVKPMPRSMIVFFIILFALAIGILFISNRQTNKTNPGDALLSGTPTPGVGTFNLTPATEAPTQPLKPTPTPLTFDQSIATYSATIKTAKGDITLSLFHDKAPKTVENFISKAKSGYYTNLTFHRVEDWVIQGGDPLGNGTGGGNIPVEFNNEPFVVGSLGQASRGDGQVQNDSQFFITKQPSDFLNGKYTNYGIVTQGMDVVNKIQIGDKILGITVQ